MVGYELDFFDGEFEEISVFLGYVLREVDEDIISRLGGYLVSLIVFC